MQSIENLFAQFSKTKVLVLGDVMLDHYLSGSAERISPEAPVPVVAVKDEYYRLGGAANVALNLKALGVDPTLCALLGKDDAAKHFQNALKEAGINSDNLIQSEERPTTVKTRVLSKSQQLLRIDKESAEDLNESEFQKLSKKVAAIFEENTPDVVILQDYDKGVLSKDLIEFVTALAQKNNTLVAVDPKFRHFFDYEHADLFKPNLAELRKAFSLESLSIEQLDGFCTPLMQQQQHKNMMVTLSDKGVYWNAGQKGNRYSARVRNIADVSGAGDTVIAVAALAMCHGLSSEQICQMSNIAGGIVCESLGVVPISPEKLADEWRNHD